MTKDQLLENGYEGASDSGSVNPIKRPVPVLPKVRRQSPMANTDSLFLS